MLSIGNFSMFQKFEIRGGSQQFKRYRLPFNRTVKETLNEYCFFLLTIPYLLVVCAFEGRFRKSRSCQSANEIDSKCPSSSLSDVLVEATLLDRATEDLGYRSWVTGPSRFASAQRAPLTP